MIGRGSFPAFQAELEVVWKPSMDGVAPAPAHPHALARERPHPSPSINAPGVMYGSLWRYAPKIALVRHAAGGLATKKSWGDSLSAAWQQAVAGMFLCRHGSFLYPFSPYPFSYPFSPFSSYISTHPLATIGSAAAVITLVRTLPWIRQIAIILNHRGARQTFFLGETRDVSRRFSPNLP